MLSFALAFRLHSLGGIASKRQQTMSAGRIFLVGLGVLAHAGSLTAAATMAPKTGLSPSRSILCNPRVKGGCASRVRDVKKKAFVSLETGGRFTGESWSGARSSDSLLKAYCAIEASAGCRLFSVFLPPSKEKEQGRATCFIDSESMTANDRTLSMQHERILWTKNDDCEVYSFPTSRMFQGAAG